MKNWGLLTAPLGIFLCGMSVLYLKMQGAMQKVTNTTLQDPLVYVPYLLAAVFLTIVIQLVVIKRHLDTFILPIILMLVSIGLVEIARLKPALLLRQMQWLCIAMLVMFSVIRLWPKIKRMLNYPYLLGIGCVFLLGLPLLFGTEIGGSKNWLVLGPVSLQPSEFGKIILLFFLASYLSDHRRVLTLPAHKFLFLRLPPLRFIAPLICIWGLAVLMFVVEKDLGSALLFFGMAVLMTYMATGSKSYVFLAMAFIGIAAAASYALFGHVRVRFDIWLDPWADPNGMAYQVVQSLFAIGTGGLWGTGFGFGHPGFIPEVHTDFIFSAIVEEMGLTAGIMLIICYALLFWRGIKGALKLKNASEALLMAGCGVLILLQMFIIIAGVTKFLPLTGITLPFVSYGGSSMVSSFILLAMLLSLTKEQKNV